MGIFTKHTKPIKPAKLSEQRTQITHTLELEADHLKITAHDKSVRTLKYDKITDVLYTTNIEESRNAKSPIGRAIAGGIVLGPIGALVGAASGIGDKTQKQIRWQLYISYQTKDGSDAFLEFTDYTLFNSSFALVSELKRRTVGKMAGVTVEL